MAELQSVMCHMDYGMTQYYLQPGTAERIRHNPSQADRYSI